MILTPEQEQQIQRILDISERAAHVWLAAAEEAHRRNAPSLGSDPLPFLNLAGYVSEPNS